MGFLVKMIVWILCKYRRITTTPERAYQMAKEGALKYVLPTRAGAISIITFGAEAHRLTNGAMVSSIGALALSQRYPSAIVAYGEFKGNPKPGVERDKKAQLFPKGLYFGEPMTTVDDITMPLEQLGLQVSPIIFVTDEMHAPSVVTIAREVLKERGSNQEFFVYCMPTRDTIDPHNPMAAQRDPRDWLAVNRFREFLLKFPVGYKILKGSGVHQPLSTTKTA